MIQNEKELEHVPAEQKTYATLLLYGCWIGIGIMVLTYFFYLSGIIEPYISIDKVTNLWHLPSDEFSQRLDIPGGWGWTALLGYGDFLNFIGIVIMGALTIIGYLVLIPAYMKKKDFLFTSIAIVEVLVLLLAASGILGGGGH